jgi:membrane protease YdiL (CAAX protease family)
MSIVQQFFTRLFEDYAKQLESLTSGNEIVVLSLMILIAPVTEELIFRGIILHKAERAVPFIGANLLQAMLFGIYHMNIVQGIYAAFIGFVLGLVYHKFKTIFAPMLLHMMINTSSLILQFVPDNYYAYCIIAVLGAILLFMALLLLFRAKTVFSNKDNFLDRLFHNNQF